jgi:phospholipid/cholesterol/gamma-HCH transport system substrate-binding protein
VARTAATLERTVDTASDELRATAKELRTTAEKIGRAAESGSADLRATVREVRLSAEKVERAADRLDDPRAVIFGPREGQLGPGEKLR